MVAFAKLEMIYSWQNNGQPRGVSSEQTLAFPSSIQMVGMSGAQILVCQALDFWEVESDVREVTYHLAPLEVAWGIGRPLIPLALENKNKTIDSLPKSKTLQ
jgi:hypothetical protein